MDICLSHTTALQALQADAREYGRISPHRATAVELAAPSSGDLKNALAYCDAHGFSKPYEMLVVRKQDQRSFSAGRTKLVTHPLPPHSFVLLAPHLYAVCPQLCFVQAASSHPLLDLVKLGYELCSTYIELPSSEQGFKSCEPMTNVAALRLCLSGCEGVRGVKEARRALASIIDGSASPRETAVTMQFALPQKYGGFGLPHPKLNYRIDLPGTGQIYYADMCWPEAKLVVEYDSNAFHSSLYSISHDSQRRANLECAGYRVITVTNGQIHNAEDMAQIAKLISRHLGRKYRSGEFDDTPARLALRRYLFGR